MMSSSVSATASQADPRLDQPHQWWEWNQGFKRLANAKQLWDVITGRERPIDKPGNIHLEDFMTYQEEVTPPTPVPVPSASRGRGRGRGGSRSNTEAPTPDSGSGPRTILVTRTRAEDSAYRMFQAAMASANRTERNWQMQMKHEEELKKWVESTIAQRYRDSCCRPELPVSDWYQNLEALVKPEASVETALLKSDFKKLATPLKAPPKNWIDWVTAWENTMSRAEALDFSFVTDPENWYDEFIAAVVQIEPDWVGSFRSNKKELIFNGHYTFQQMTNDFRNHLQTKYQHSLKHKVLKGSFLSHADHEAPVQDEEVPEEPKPRRGTKRERRNTNVKCFVCENTGHRLADCYYVFKEKAPKTWKPSSKLAKKIEENLKKEVKAELERVKGKKAKTQNLQASNVQGASELPGNE